LVPSSSILNICVIGILRYCAITRPLVFARCRKTRRKAVILIAAAWGVAISTSAPLPVTWLLNDGEDAAVGSCVFYSDIGVVLYTASVTYFIPVAVMAFVTCATCRKLRMRCRIIAEEQLTSHRRPLVPASQSELPLDACMAEQRRQEDSTFKTSATPEVDRSESMRMRVFAISTVQNSARTTDSYMTQWNATRVTRRHFRSIVSLIVIAMTVIVCWSPFYFIYVVRPICRRCQPPPSLITGAIWAGYINSTLNPLIYACVNANFRKSFRKILGCTFRRYV